MPRWTYEEGLQALLSAEGFDLVISCAGYNVKVKSSMMRAASTAFSQDQELLSKVSQPTFKEIPRADQSSRARTYMCIDLDYDLESLLRVLEFIYTGKLDLKTPPALMKKQHIHLFQNTKADLLTKLIRLYLIAEEQGIASLRAEVVARIKSIHINNNLLRFPKNTSRALRALYEGTEGNDEIWRCLTERLLPHVSATGKGRIVFQTIQKYGTLDWNDVGKIEDTSDRERQRDDDDAEDDMTLVPYKRARRDSPSPEAGDTVENTAMVLRSGTALPASTG